MQSARFAHYILLEHMGRGGVGTVYRARDERTGAIVAVKVFESGPDRPPEVARKLRDREVRMLVSVQHPNIVSFLDAGEVGDDCWYAMEFVEDNLFRCIRKGNEFDLVTRVHILRQAAAALVAMHQRGIVHRDVKPGNILLDRDPNGAVHVKLTDLGIAKEVGETEIVQAQGPARVDGTAKYLSPEQIARRRVDGRADVFSLGVVAYELLTGRPPFDAETTEQHLLANAQQHQTPAHQVASDVPEFLGEMVEKMLRKDREERYDSEDLLRDLQLTEQHLVSGAPLMDRLHPGSLFYVPPEQEAAPEGQKGLMRQVSPLSWALAAAIIAGGALLGSAVRRDSGQAEPASTAAELSTTPAAPRGNAALDVAAAALDAGRYWQAGQALRSLDGSALSPGQQARRDELSARAQSAIADELYAVAAQMLRQGRQYEAEVVLEAMKEFAPDAERTKQLEGTIADMSRVASADDQWQLALSRSRALIRQGRYREALKAQERLLELAGGDAERAASARQTLAELMSQWGDALLKGRPQPEEVERFIEAARAHADVLAAAPRRTALGRLHLYLARIYRARGDGARALEHYRQAAGLGDTATGRIARHEESQLRRQMLELPEDPAGLARKMRASGFGGSLWTERGSSGGTQQLDGGVLTMRPLGAAARLERRTLRPVRGGSFAAGVRFKLADGGPARSGSWRAGLRLEGTDDVAFDFAFDGRFYRIAARSAGRSVGGGVHAALGDEERAWHELGLRYDLGTASLTVLVDGQPVGEYPLELSDFRLVVFLEGERRGGPAVMFRDVYLRPLAD